MIWYNSIREHCAKSFQGLLVRIPAWFRIFAWCRDASAVHTESEREWAVHTERDLRKVIVQFVETNQQTKHGTPKYRNHPPKQKQVWRTSSDISWMSWTRLSNYLFVCSCVFGLYWVPFDSLQSCMVPRMCSLVFGRFVWFPSGFLVFFLVFFTAGSVSLVWLLAIYSWIFCSFYFLGWLKLMCFLNATIAHPVSSYL